MEDKSGSSLLSVPMRLDVPTIRAARSPAVARRGDHPGYRIAAIDVGSNSIHMIVVAVYPDGDITTLWRIKEMVGLGRVSFPSRRLPRKAIDQAVATLRWFQSDARQRQAEKILAVATSAVREAENGGRLIELAKREVGMDIRVVSGKDEAKLIYLGVRQALGLTDGPHMIVDVGGGSTEFIVGDAHRALLLESRKLGAARMTAAYIKSDPPKSSEIDALLRHYDKEMGPICQSAAALKPIRVIGTSGTLENLAALSSPPESTGKPTAIERKPFQRLLDQLLKSNTKQRGRLRGLDPQRRDQVIAGALLVEQLFRKMGMDRIELCGSALREGIVLEYLSRHVPELETRQQIPDPRRRSVIELGRRCQWHQAHAEQVARLCSRLFDDLRPVHGLGDAERELIEYGALLHDIGWHVGRKSHHKHSAYLVSKGRLSQFTKDEVAVIANIARYHRKSPPKRTHSGYMALPPSCRRIVDVGASLLRIADGLDRSHAANVKDLRCRIREAKVICTLNVRSDAELEVWAANQKSDMFAKTFTRMLEIKVARA